MTDTPSPMDPTAPIAIDLPCLQCSYNLRTLSLSATCPECGLPVAKTLEGDALALADKAWLAVQHRGIQLLRAAFLSLVVIILIILTATVALTATRSNPLTAAYLVAVLTLGLGIVSTLLIFMGLTRLAQREPNPRQRPNGLDTQSVLLGAAWGGLGFGLVLPLLAIADPEAAQTAAVLNTPILCLQAMSILAWIRRLFARAGRLNLARQSRFLYWGVVVAGALWAASTAMIQASLRGAPPATADVPAAHMAMGLWMHKAGAGMSCGASLAGITIAIWLMVLLRMLGRELGRHLGVGSAPAPGPRL